MARPLLVIALSHTEGNRIRAAAPLGIHRSALRVKIAEFDLVSPGRK